VGDLNNDGNLDLVVSNVSGEGTNGRAGGFRELGSYSGGIVIFRNDTASGNRSLTIKLVGSDNTHGIGARVTVSAQGKELVRELRAGEGHLGANANELHFGIGSAQNVTLIQVKWPSGGVTTVNNLNLNEGNTVVTINE
jgi:hypothetical protein